MRRMAEELRQSETHIPASDTIWAASPELSDVQAAINAASPGDTVRVPAGSATWTARLEITKPILEEREKEKP